MSRTNTLAIAACEYASGVPTMIALAPRKTIQLDAAATIGLTRSERDGEFDWELIAAPDGSGCHIEPCDGCRAAFTPDVAGRYLVRLRARTVRGRTHHVIRVCTANGTGAAITTLEIKARG